MKQTKLLFTGYNNYWTLHLYSYSQGVQYNNCYQNKATDRMVESDILNENFRFSSRFPWANSSL